MGWTLPGDRLTGLRGDSDRDTYRRAKSTWPWWSAARRAAGCSRSRRAPTGGSTSPGAARRTASTATWPARCRARRSPACTPTSTRSSAGSAPRRARARSPRPAERGAEGTTFEASCYTDPLGLEHLTARSPRRSAVRHGRPAGRAAALHHEVRRASTTSSACPTPAARGSRFSVNAAAVAARFEGGTAPLAARLGGARRLARGRLSGRPDDRPDHAPPGLARALRRADRRRGGRAGRRRPTPTSRSSSSPTASRRAARRCCAAGTRGTCLEMDEEGRTLKRTKFGARQVRLPARRRCASCAASSRRELAERLPAARILYWT